MVAAMFALGMLFASAASAHATVVGSDPVDGSRLQTVPKTVTITFDEPVDLGAIGYLNITTQDGHRADTSPAYHPGDNGAKLANDLTAAGLGDGTYTASYRVVSADGHPVAGVIRFVVGNGELVVSQLETAASKPSTSALFDVARWVSYAGFALLGGVWLLLTVWPAGRDELRARRIVWTGWWLAAVGAVVELLLQGPYTAGRGLDGLGQWSLLESTLGTGYGQLHSVRIVLLGLLAIVLGFALQGEWRRRTDDLAWPLLLGCAVTFSAGGHAETTNPRWLSIALDTVHFSAMAVWLGGLAMLVAAVLPRRDRDELGEVLPVFSRVALGCVGLLVVTGVYAAWRGVGLWRALFGTEYGLLVSVKILLLLGVMAVAYVARRVVQHRAFDHAVATERLRRGVLVEVAAAMLVLVATSVLVAQPRGREAIAAEDARPVSGVARLLDDRTATVTVDPGKHGPVSVTVALSAGAAPLSVTATATQKDARIGPVPIKLTAGGPDRYRATGINLPVGGPWTFSLVVTVSKTDAVTTDVTITIH